MPTVSRTLDWSEWQSTAFAHASRQNVPVLLYLSASWSAECERLDDTVFADSSLQAVVADHFVPVRVDVDVRPDIASRYGLGGWPTVLVLTPEGDVLTGGQALTTGRLVGALARVFDAFRQRRAELQQVAASTTESPWPLPTAGSPVDHEAPLRFLTSAVETLEGSPNQVEYRRLLQPVVVHALVVAASRADDARTRATIDTLVEHFVAELLEAGEHRLAYVEDLLEANAEFSPARLESNAACVEFLIDAGRRLRRDDLLERAKAVVSFIRHSLHHPAGGFVDHGTGGHAPAGANARRFVDGNAVAAKALLKAASVLDAPDLAELAVAALEQVSLAGYERGTGLAHVLDPNPRLKGLLSDQVSAAAALIEAHDASQMRVYLDLAEELMRHALRIHWHPDAQAFQDRASVQADGEQIGLLGRPFFSLAQNALAARVLARLASRTGAPDLLSRAQEVLGACSSLPPVTEHDAAHHVLAVLELSAA